MAMGATAAGRLELKILGLTGDPKTSDEVHLHVSGKGTGSLTLVVPNPRGYSSQMFRQGNKVVLSQEQGTLQLREVYSGRKQVYSAAKD